MEDFEFVVVPGLNGSDNNHWQSLWEKQHPSWTRVEQVDWETPTIDLWSKRVAEVINSCKRPPVIVAHSFGCLATVHAANFSECWIAGVLMVAPADPDKFGLEMLFEKLSLNFPSTLVASQNDPWMTFERAQKWSATWGCTVLDAGRVGHINSESNLGNWSFGFEVLQKLVNEIAIVRH